MKVKWHLDSTLSFPLKKGTKGSGSEMIASECKNLINHITRMWIANDSICPEELSFIDGLVFSDNGRLMDAWEAVNDVGH